jgi:hypothetical protein
MSDNLPVTQSGAGGAAPPPGAPNEVSQSLSADAGRMSRPQPGDPGYETYRQLAERAAAAGLDQPRELAPLTFGTGVAEAVEAVQAGKIDPFFERIAAEKQSGIDPAPAAKATKRVSFKPRPAVPAEGDPATTTALARDVDGDTAPPAPLPIPPVDDATIRGRAPAFSDTDTPARGIPRQPTRAGKEITGGFGDQASLQYFALNGQELRVLVESLMDKVYNRIQNDLRFNEALTYPQVGVRVVVEVEGFVHDADFLVDQILPTTHDARTKTPTALARTLADHVAFVLIEGRSEVDEATGDPVDSPDAVRQDLGLVRPMKRAIRTPSGDQFIDV